MGIPGTFKEKKIPKYFLEEDLVKEIEGKADSSDVWKKSSPITMDAFDSNVRNKLNNIAPPGATSYDDTEIRSRIISLERNSISSKDAFNRNTDKVSEGLLDSNLSELINNIRLSLPLVKEKAGKAYLDSSFRRKDVSIYQSDLDKALSDKINNLVASVNNITAQSGISSSINSDIEALKKEVKGLSSSAVTGETLKNYRLKTEPVAITDLEASAEKALRSAVSVTEEVNRKLNTADAEILYRKKSDLINISDMDTGLQDTINKVSLAVESNEASVTQIFNEKLFASVKTWARDYFGTLMYSEEDKLGHVYPYQFAHNVCSFAGNLGTGTANAGKLTFCSITNYLYDRLNKADSSISSVNTSLLALRDNGVTDIEKRTSSLETETADIKKRTGSLETETADLKAKLSAAETAIGKLEKRIEELESKKNEATKV